MGFGHIEFKVPAASSSGQGVAGPEERGLALGAWRPAWRCQVLRRWRRRRRPAGAWGGRPGPFRGRPPMALEQCSSPIGAQGVGAVLKPSLVTGSGSSPRWGMVGTMAPRAATPRGLSPLHTAKCALSQQGEPWSSAAAADSRMCSLVLLHRVPESQLPGTPPKTVYRKHRDALPGDPVLGAVCTVPPPPGAAGSLRLVSAPGDPGQKGGGRGGTQTRGGPRAVPLPCASPPVCLAPSPQRSATHLTKRSAWHVT